MPLPSQELTKLYYTIGEVADMFDVSKSLIRFWETEFDLLRPHKNSKGDRRFTQQNIQYLKLIYTLVKERGFTLKGAKKELTENKEKLIQKQNTADRLKKESTENKEKLIQEQNTVEKLKKELAENRNNLFEKQSIVDKLRKELTENKNNLIQSQNTTDKLRKELVENKNNLVHKQNTIDKLRSIKISLEKLREQI